MHAASGQPTDGDPIKPPKNPTGLGTKHVWPTRPGYSWLQLRRPWWCAQRTPTPLPHSNPMPTPAPAPPHPHPALRQGGGVQAEQLSDRNARGGTVATRRPRGRMACVGCWPTDVRAIGAAECALDWQCGGGTDLDTVVKRCSEKAPKKLNPDRRGWWCSPLCLPGHRRAPRLALCSSRAQGPVSPSRSGCTAMVCRAAPARSARRCAGGGDGMDGMARGVAATLNSARVVLVFDFEFLWIFS